MKQHKRVAIVREAEIDLRERLLGFQEKYGEKLTMIEFLQVLNRVLSDELASVLKYAIREERHGDPNKPGDVA